MNKPICGEPPGCRQVGSISSLDYNMIAIRLGQFLVAPVARMMELEPWTRCARSNSASNAGCD